MADGSWYMLTIVGQDRVGIVAQVTTALAESLCNLGETSMLRLGGNFTMMMMVRFTGNEVELLEKVKKVAQSLNLKVHVDAIDGQLHHHRDPNVRISAYSADRVGIIAKLSSVLAKAGLDICDLESDVGGTEAEPVYIVQIEGRYQGDIELLEQVLSRLDDSNIHTRINTIDTLVG